MRWPTADITPEDGVDSFGHVAGSIVMRAKQTIEEGEDPFLDALLPEWLLTALVSSGVLGGRSFIRSWLTTLEPSSLTTIQDSISLAKSQIPTTTLMRLEEIRSTIPTTRESVSNPTDTTTSSPVLQQEDMNLLKSMLPRLQSIYESSAPTPTTAFRKSSSMLMK